MENKKYIKYEHLLNSKQLFERAKDIDEQYVITAINECKSIWTNALLRLGTQEEDLNHKDIIVIHNNIEFSIDIKRNSLKNIKSDNFSLALKNKTTGKRYNYNNDNYFAFIDESDDNQTYIYLILQKEIHNITKNLDKSWTTINKKFIKQNSIILAPKNNIKQ